MTHPQKGGRHYREADGSLTRAGDDGKHPLGDGHVDDLAKANAAAANAAAAAAKTETQAAPAADAMKGDSDA